MKNSVVVFFSLLFFLGCQATPVQVRPVLPDEGEVLLYVGPFPPDADRLRFNLENISAVRNDGVEFPFSLSLSDFNPGNLTRQRFLALGQLPEGTYKGLSFKVKNASLTTEEEENALLIPEKPVEINFSFSVIKKKSLLLSLSFNYAQSIENEVSFNPAFSVSTPSMPLIGLEGYVLNRYFRNIIVFDKKAGQVVGVIPTGTNPGSMVLDQKLNRAYVSLPEEDAVDAFDVLSGDLLGRINLNIGDGPGELALSPDGSVLLTANSRSNTISITDPISYFERSRITVPQGVSSLLMDRSGTKVFVFNSSASTISVLDVPSGSIVASVVTDRGPLRGQFNRKGDMLYVFYQWSPYISIMDPATLSVLRKVLAGQGVSYIKVDTNTDKVYIGKISGPDVEVYNPLEFYNPYSLSRSDYIKVGNSVTYMNIDGSENNLYLLLPERKGLRVVNLVSRKTVYELDVGNDPYWIVLKGER